MNSHPWVKHFAWGDVGQIFISRKCNYKPELLWGAIKGQTNISSLEHLPKAQEHIPATWNPCLQSSVTQSLVPAGPKEARKEKSLRRIRICVRCKVQGDSVQTTNKYLQPDCLLWKQEGYFPLSAVPGWWEITSHSPCRQQLRSCSFQELKRPELHLKARGTDKGPGRNKEWIHSTYGAILNMRKQDLDQWILTKTP